MRFDDSITAKPMRYVGNHAMLSLTLWPCMGYFQIIQNLHQI